MNIKFAVVFALAVVVASVWSGTISLSPIGGDTQSASSADEVVKVKAKGVGANKTEALKDAYRDAVERAVGLFVDAEQMIKNDEILKDQVLAQSNAYIEKYDLARESEAGGLVHVDILAVVRKSALVTKISGFMPVQTQNLGNTMQNLHAQIVSTEKRNEDGAALLQNFMKDFDPIRQLVGVGLASTTPAVKDCKGDPDRKAIYYRYKFSLDDNRYKNDFLPKFRQLLTQVSVAPVKKIRLAAQSKGIIDFNSQDIPTFMNDPFDESIMKRYVRHGKGMYERLNLLSADMDGRVCVFTGIGSYLNFGYPLKEVKMQGMCYGIEKEKIVGVILVTEFNSSKSSCVAELYSLDPKVGSALGGWWMEYFGCRKTVPCSAEFKDAKGESVEVARFEVEINCLSIIGRFELEKMLGGNRGRREGPNLRNSGLFYVAPLLGCEGVDYCQWVPCEIRKDDLARIASVSVELGD